MNYSISEPDACASLSDTEAATMNPHQDNNATGADADECSQSPASATEAEQRQRRTKREIMAAKSIDEEDEEDASIPSKRMRTSNNGAKTTGDDEASYELSFSLDKGNDLDGNKRMPTPEFMQEVLQRLFYSAIPGASCKKDDNVDTTSSDHMNMKRADKTQAETMLLKQDGSSLLEEELHEVHQKVDWLIRQMAIKRDNIITAIGSTTAEQETSLQDAASTAHEEEEDISNLALQQDYKRLQQELESKQAELDAAKEYISVSQERYEKQSEALAHQSQELQQLQQQKTQSEVLLEQAQADLMSSRKSFLEIANKVQEEQKLRRQEQTAHLMERRDNQKAWHSMFEENTKAAKQIKSLTSQNQILTAQLDQLQQENQMLHGKVDKYKRLYIIQAQSKMKSSQQQVHDMNLDDFIASTKDQRFVV